MRLFTLSASLLLALCSQAVQAGAINTSLAITPRDGGTVVRSQWRYTRFDDGAAERSVFPVTVIHGLTADTALQFTAPSVHLEARPPGGPAGDDSGLADLTFLAKHRFFQRDEPGETTGMALIAGAELPSDDQTFSSESTDPLVGTVWSWNRWDRSVAVDFLYKFNTSGGADDLIRANAAYSHRLFGAETGGG
ncbi:MAG: transporter, partial [Phycisphaerae bacterium]|nr:transporter [Phycisphaerae bacterium]